MKKVKEKTKFLMQNLQEPEKVTTEAQDSVPPANEDASPGLHLRQNPPERKPHIQKIEPEEYQQWILHNMANAIGVLRDEIEGVNQNVKRLEAHHKNYEQYLQHIAQNSQYHISFSENQAYALNHHLKILDQDLKKVVKVKATKAKNDYKITDTYSYNQFKQTEIDHQTWAPEQDRAPFASEDMWTSLDPANDYYNRDYYDPEICLLGHEEDMA
jgi:CRISPR/Cas system-associated endoribonuclease Cas2